MCNVFHQCWALGLAVSLYKLAAPRIYIYFWPAFVTRLLTPRSRKFGYGPLLGCRSGLDRGLFEKTFCWQSSNPKPGKIFTLCFGPQSQSIGCGRISREGALDVRESRERRHKIVPNLLPKKQKKRNFGLNVSTFFSRIACCWLLFAWVEIGVTEFPTKTAKKEEGILSVCLSFFQKTKVGAQSATAHPSKFSFFLPRKN